MADSPKAQNAIEEHDDRIVGRCPMLGGEVPFRYCRKMQGGRPCSRVVGCWKTLFDIQKFLRTHYDLDELDALWNQPRPDKVSQLADLIKQAKKQKP